MKKTFAFFLVLFVLFAAGISADDKLERGFKNPPDEARLWAYWWWLNGNVTPVAITRDLEQMKEKGFGGAIVFDAGGATQDGNASVPAGPMYSTPEWIELFLHAVREADRLGLSLSLNIMSGWNLGGPIVTPEYAAKHLVHAETEVKGGQTVDIVLNRPQDRFGFYKDIGALALKSNETDLPHVVETKASSFQPDRQPEHAVDSDIATFWVSNGSTAATGPTPEKPQWIEVRYSSPIETDGLFLIGRLGYGPKECILAASDDGKVFKTVKEFTAEDGKENAISFNKTGGRVFRLTIRSSYDPRNVQIADMALSLAGNRHIGPTKKPVLSLFPQKISVRELAWSAPDCRPLMKDEPEIPGETFPGVAEVVDLTGKMDAEGRLRWDAPSGKWTVLRFGYVPTGAEVSTASGDWQGLVLDYLSDEAFDFYWEKAVKPVLDAAGSRAGRTVRYLHTDSWEAGGMNWSPKFREEFIKRRGYDPLPYLPVIAGHILDSRMTSNRFLNDYRRTIGDMLADHHYGRMREKAAAYDIGTHPESGGPHGAPIDSLQLLGISDIPMSEYWSWSPRHRIGDANRFFTKQPASAAHTHGRKLVAAEGFTNIGMHWQESFSDNLKPSFDQAVCEGMNLLVWHAFTCSPDEQGFPGQEYFAGTHFNPRNVTWCKSQPFLAYINRVQFMLQLGIPHADVLEYYGENVPNFTQRKGGNTAGSLPGYDYDVACEQVILNRIKEVRDGKIVLEDGVNYRVLVLPERTSISSAALRRIDSLVRAGATVLGPKPVRTTGLDPTPISNDIWNEDTQKTLKGRVIQNISSHDLLRNDGVPFDFERVSGTNEKHRVDWIHRTVYKNQLDSLSLRKFAEFSPRDVDTVPADLASGFGAEVYYIANLSNAEDKTVCAFRVTGRQPELWNPLTGEIVKSRAFSQDGNRTFVPLDFDPFGSTFVVFREPIDVTARGIGKSNSSEFVESKEIAGPWSVRFDPEWGGPKEPVEFVSLESWTKHADPGIRFYSGIAIYSKEVDIPLEPGRKVFLEFGDVDELAEVKINGLSCGGVWAAPFRIEITEFVKAGKNRIDVEVANHWANRVIGDVSKPADERLTKTNIGRLEPTTPLVDSGLIGPVQLRWTAP